MISLYVIGLLSLAAILWLAVYARTRKRGTAGFGKITLQVSGAQSVSRTGKANFDVLELDKDVRSSARIWVISMRDEWSKRFNFQLSLSSLCDGGLTQPIPGSYAIAPGSYGSTRAFSASYSHIVDGDKLDVYEYSTLHKGGGVLIIETADDSEVSGSFIFIAHRHDSSLANLGVIEVSGKFTAPKVV